jgi:hypothetical protein
MTDFLWKPKTSLLDDKLKEKTWDINKPLWNINTPQTTLTTETPQETYQSELDTLHPFKVPSEKPLWAKVLNIAFKPFELIQEYLFDPVLGAIQTSFAQKNLTSQELTIAKSEGIRSYFPGGMRHKAYEQLKYPFKWLVELLPWLIVPPVGLVGATGKAGKGIAGALGKLGTVGKITGKALEYSPAGLTEKAIGGVLKGITGRFGKRIGDEIPKAIESKEPSEIKAITAIQKLKNKIPEQKVLTHELRVQQFTKALEARNSIRGEAGAIAAAKAMGISGEKVEVQGIRNQLTKSEVNNLYDKIGDYFKSKGEISKPADDALRVILDGGNLPFPSQIKSLARVFPELAQTLVDKHQSGTIYAITEIGNIFRSTLASGDVSFMGRQGAILATRFPREVPLVFQRMLKTVYSDKNAELLDQALRGRRLTSIADQLVGEKGYKLDLTAVPSEYGKLPISAREESAASKWIQNFPILGSLVKGSNRAYVSAANDFRSMAWEKIGSSWETLVKKNQSKIDELVSSGKWNMLSESAQKKMIESATLKSNDWSELAKLINVVTGRGILPKMLRGSSTLLNATLFSPKLFFSRIQFPMMLFSSSALVRKEAARMLLQFMGAGTAVLGIAGAIGAQIEWNPQSSDFGKIKIGDTRLDIWTGYAQWTRLIAQLTTAKKKTAGGQITDVNRAEIVQRFLQSKASPLTGLLYDILRGETYMGEEVSLDTESLQRQAYTRIMPLAAQDLIDAIDQEGLLGGTIAGISSGLGVGVVTYMSDANKLREQLSQDKYKMSWEDVGLKMGRSAQLSIERSSPKLLALITKEREDYNKTITGKADINNIYRTQTETIESSFRSNVNQAVQEYKDTGSGYNFKEKLLTIASNRRSQYDVLNQNPQFKDIVARYDELPTAQDLKKMSPQDLARKEYNRLMYSDDMYDQYGNYRFDMIDEVKKLFVDTFGQTMLDYVEEYQGIKESDMPDEYKMFKQAQKVLRPYWEVENKIIESRGLRFAQSKYGQALIARTRKLMRMTNPEMDKLYRQFYTETNL